MRFPKRRKWVLLAGLSGLIYRNYRSERFISFEVLQRRFAYPTLALVGREMFFEAAKVLSWSFAAVWSLTIIAPKSLTGCMLAFCWA